MQQHWAIARRISYYAASGNLKKGTKERDLFQLDIDNTGKKSRKKNLKVSRVTKIG